MKITNSKAFFNYEIKDRFEAGINLYGAEVKAIRLGHADLTGSFVRITGSEAYLINAKVFPYEFARPDGFEQNRTRKLLLHKKEIISLKSKTEATNLTIVPISLYTTKTLVKVELGIGKPKKEYDKRQSIKKRDIERAVEEEFKQKLD